MKQRAGLVAKVRELQGRLEEEGAARSALKDKVQRRLAAAEQEVRAVAGLSGGGGGHTGGGHPQQTRESQSLTSRPHAPCLPQVAALRGELEGKVAALQGLQAGMKALQGDAEAKLAACEAQLLGCKERTAHLAAEAEAERQRAAKVGEQRGGGGACVGQQPVGVPQKHSRLPERSLPPPGTQARSEAEAACEERAAVQLQQQALAYERRIQELEAAGCRGAWGWPLAAMPLPLPRRLAGREVTDPGFAPALPTRTQVQQARRAPAPRLAAGARCWITSQGPSTCGCWRPGWPPKM